MSFPLIGNAKIKQSVENCLRENRLPHAILIEGDKGNGRHTLAKYIASSAVCSGETVPCGECKNCVMAEGGNHPDIVVIAPEEGKKNISVAQVRDVKNDAYIKPHMAQKKVFIIDYADTLNDQSQNALLKVLEEPPVAVTFILIAETKASFLETIISRCVVLTLSTPEKQLATEYILSKTDFSRIDVEEALEISQNNVGKALMLLAGKGDTEVSAAAKEFLECMLRSDSWGMLNATAKAEKNRLQADLFFKDLKRVVALNIKQNYANSSAVLLSRFYSEVCELEKSLISNINLGLLFCALVSKAEKIINTKR